jgi:hypothetical protein
MKDELSKGKLWVGVDSVCDGIFRRVAVGVSGADFGVWVCVDSVV